MKYKLCLIYLIKRPKIRKNQLAATKTNIGSIALSTAKCPISDWSPWAARQRCPMLTAEAANTAVMTMIDLIENTVRFLARSRG